VNVDKKIIVNKKKKKLKENTYQNEIVVFKDTFMDYTIFGLN
jgi:hypothetical protein